MPYTIPPDTLTVGSGAPAFDMDHVSDVLSGNGLAFNILNTVWGTADPTGVADSTAAINAALAAAGPGQNMIAPPGIFRISAPLNMATKNVSFNGFGLGNTDRTGATVLLIDPGFTGTAVINITAPGCQVNNLCIMGPTTTTTSNPIANGIEITGAKFCNLQNLFMQYINGWCVESVATASVANIGTSLYNITGYNSAGGVHVKGVSGSSFQAQHSLTDMQFSQIGVATGANANLDALFFEDCQDILTLNTNCAVSSASTGSTIHIKGACATHTHTNVDVGVFPVAGTQNAVIKIEDSAGGSPTQIVFDTGVAQAGQQGLLVSGGANQLIFDKMWFKNQQTHGAQLSGTGFQIDFQNCWFALNGQGATGTNYDLNNSGTATGKVTDCYLISPVVAALSVGVQNPVNIGTSGTDLKFVNTAFLGSGVTLGTVFTNLPSLVRGCKNYNPHGAQAVGVPASGSATTGLHYDAMFYITAGATAVTVVKNTAGQGGGTGPTITIPASACVSVFVPAQATITPTYTNAPTWVVDGL